MGGDGATVASVDDSYPPAGFGLGLDPSLRRLDRGRILVGGTPLRVVKLSPGGADVVDSWHDGEPLDVSTAQRRLARRLLDAAMVHPRVTPTSGSDVPGVPDRREVTAVVPVRDNPSGLDRCLGGLADIAVVVIDDASDDAVSHRRIAKRHGAGYIRRDATGGPGAARTSGLARVETEFVAFVDSDVEVRPGWLEGLCGHFADPMVVAVAPRIRSRRGSGLLAAYEREHSPLDLGDTPGPVGPGRMVSYVPTAALVARASAITDVGGFDPDMVWGEDVDLIWRLVAGGGVVRYEPSVELLHEPRPDWTAWVTQRRRYGASAAALARRHGDKVAPARCSRWSAGAWLLVAAGHPVIGAALAAGSTAALARRLDSLPHPRIEAVRLAGRGHLMAGLGLARATSRVWWPLAAALAVAVPRRRAAVAAVVVAPAVVDWMQGRRPADGPVSIALRTADDMAYGLGVWQGVVAERTITPLVPKFSEWPGRRAVIDDADADDPMVERR